MPLSPRPLHPADHPHRDEASSGFREWSSRASDAPLPTGKARASQPLLPGIDLTHPLAKVAAVVFVGYTLGRLLHRRARHVDLPPSSQPSPRARTMPEPMTTYRGRHADVQRSSIRFR